MSWALVMRFKEEEEVALGSWMRSKEKDKGGHRWDLRRKRVALDYR